MTGKTGRSDELMGDLFLKAVNLKRDAVSSFKEYPFSIPSIRELDELNIRSPVTRPSP